MTAINISKFFGAALGVTPRHIPNGYAQSLLDVDVSLGTLAPAKGLGYTEEEAGLGSPKTIHKYASGHWFAWSQEVNVVRSPLTDDAWKRVYWTGQGEPKMGAIDMVTGGGSPYPSTWYSLGVPAPDGIIGVTGPTGEEPSTAVTTVYACAFVTGYDEVGPLSDPSQAVTRWDDGGDVTLAIPSVSATGRNITKVRIFRSEAGGDYNYVADVAAGTATFVDSVQSDELLSPAESIDWDVPPENLQGLIAGPGNALYGFFENVLCASESGYPHAWPVDYRLSFQNDIVAIAESAAGIVVATTGMPWLVTGASPAALAPIKLETLEPCVSKRSMVDMGDYVIYASPNGLVAVGASGASLITKGVLSREAWQTFNPDTIHAYRDRERYLAFYDGGCFAFSADLGFEQFSESADAAFYSGMDDVLYVQQSGDSTYLNSWNAGDTKTLTWRSGIYEVQPGTSFTCGKVVAEGYPLYLTVYADGQEAFNVTVGSSQMFRLPSNIFAREYEVMVASGYEIFSIQLAQSPSELV
ncbi:MAG: hypothetical protein ACPGMR_03220 [Pontibacterium sp.]